MKKTILVIDDDKRILLLFKRILNEEKYFIEICTEIYQAINKINDLNIDLIIADLNLQEGNGLELLTYLKTLSNYIPFIVITGYGSIESAVNAVKLGAIEYVIKPFHKKHIIDVIENALKEGEYRNNLDTKSQQDPFEDIIGQSNSIKNVFSIIKRVAPSSATILIQGESGTGKELIARAIHNRSTRSKKPFVAINCSVLSENLLENELFGHTKGAFTGALNYKPGLFEIADGGTLLLDEIGDMPLQTQTKLLRVLQEKEFKPLGSNKEIQTNFRVIACTNVDLKKAMVEKKFREDLYYRLAVIEIQVPPLRERLSDISLLAQYFIKKYSEKNNKNIEMISPEALAKLKENRWTGNVRELENTIERVVTLATTNVIDPNLLWQNKKNYHLPPSFAQDIIQSIDNSIKAESLKDIIDIVTKKAIVYAINKAEGNKSKAADLLGIGRASLYNKIKELDIE